jgi:Protein  of unknown function (DUF3018)
MDIGMTFHNKLTDAERAELRARGYRPVEVWLRRRDAAFWDEVLAEAREIAGAEDEADLDLFIEDSARETFRLIDEMEREGGEK